MYAKVFSVSEKVSVLDVAIKMVDEKVGSLLVKEGDSYIGIDHNKRYCA